MIKLRIFAAIIYALAAASAYAQIPAASAKYKATVIRETHAAWGLTGRPSVFAAQIQQESDWNPNAKSGVGAVGISQFMPTSSAFVAAAYPKQLGGPAPLDPQWALRALLFYDLWIYQRMGRFQEGDQRLGASLAGYNSGLGWIWKEQEAAKTNIYFGGSNQVCLRSAASCAQTKAYPQRIMYLYAPRYFAAGWR